MAASHTAVAPRAHWAVRMNWKNRSTSFALLGLALGSQVQAQHGAVWLWGLLVLQFLVYPHLLYVRGLYADHPRKAECSTCWPMRCALVPGRRCWTFRCG
jgi:hypothetical protein